MLWIFSEFNSTLKLQKLPWFKRIKWKLFAEKIPNSKVFQTQKEAASYVLEHAKPGDLVLTLGCGDIYKCARMIVFGKF